MIVPRPPSTSRSCSRAAVALSLLLLPSLGLAQSGDKDSGGSSLGDLLNKVKDIKVPDKVSNLPTQLTDLKEAYLETADTVEELRLEVAALREEVEALKSENSELRDAVGNKATANARSELLKPVEISASELVAAYKEDRESATKSYGRRYLRVVGLIEAFEPGVQEIVILLRTDLDARVRCHIKRDANFHAEVLAAQGRVVSRNDRSTLLTVGQPVAILGTCSGMDLDLKLDNCRVEGVTVKRVEERDNSKKRR